MKGLKVSSKKMRHISLFICVLVYMASATYIVNTCKGSGILTFISALTPVALLLFCFPFALLEFVSKNVREQLDIMNSKNSVRILVFSNMALFVYLGLCCVLIFSFIDKIKKYVLFSPYGYIILYSLIPFLIFTSFCFIFYGFFLGARVKNSLYTIFMSKAVLTFVLIIVFSGFFDAKGVKAEKILYDPNIPYIFKGAGIALGMSVASFIAFVACIINYRNHKMNIVTGDKTKRRIDIYDFVSRLIKPAVLLSINQITLPLMMIVASRLIFMIMNKAGYSKELISYRETAYFVYLPVITFMPLALSYMYSFFDRKSIAVSTDTGDMHEIRFKITEMHKKFAIYYFPFVIYLTVNAPCILNGVFGVKSEFMTHVLYVCLPAGIAFGMMMLSKNILIGLGELFASALTSFISIGVMALIMIFGGGILGSFLMPVSIYAFAVIYMLLSMLFVRRNVKYSPGFNKRFLRPILVMVPVFVITLVLRLLLSLFMPDLMILVITGVIDFFIVYIFYILSGAVTYMSVSKSPYAFVLLPLGKMLGLKQRN